MKVVLSGSEICFAASVGIFRHIECAKRGARPAYGLDADDNPWQKNIEGALAEAAFAKLCNIYWAKGEVGATDVGNFEVRSTPYMGADAKLLMHAKDLREKSNSKFFLMCGKNGTYDLRGYIFPADAVQDKYYEDHFKNDRPCYAVPSGELEPIDDAGQWKIGITNEEPYLFPF